MVPDTTDAGGESGGTAPDAPTAGRRAEAEQELEVPSVTRLLSLSDGVVAIAITLIVLQLKVPTLSDPNSASQLAAKLNEASSQFTAYVVSFYVIAVFWLAHHRVFRLVRGHDEGLAWWNFVFLFTISVMPFTSDLMGTYSENPLAVDVFALNLLLASLATQGATLYSRRHHLLVAGVDQATMREHRARAFVTVTACATSMAVAWISPTAARYVWILLIATPSLGRWWGRRGTDSGATTSVAAPATT
jgi:uncharacterized membrane protein